MIIELALLGITIFLIYHFFFEFRASNLPPGPTPWPIIGNINLTRGKPMHLILTKLAEQYGKIYRLYNGHNLMIVLSGDAIKEALVRQPKNFAGRIQLPFKVRKGGPELLILDYGAKWKLYRKLGHSAIKVYGEGRLQEVISKEVDELCKRLQALDGKPLNIAIQLHKAVTNVICTKLLGERYEVDDPEFLKIYHINDQISRFSFKASIRQLFPFLSFLLPEEKQTKLTRTLANERFEFLLEKYLQHAKKFDRETIRDYTDALLYTKQQAEQEDSANKKYLDDSTMVIAGLASLFTAGSETTSNTLSWAVVYLLHNPNIQDRLHKEIDDVIGRDDFPSLSNHKKHLPILEAFTAETLRTANLAPLSIPHKTTVDTVLEGYNIPKDTRVITNLWALHHDPTIWKDPFKFSVDRFLDEAGNFKSPVGGTFLPFGAGVRVCLGEVLARSELFLFLSRLLQQFKFENPSGCDLPFLEGDEGIVLHPKPYIVCAKKRD